MNFGGDDGGGAQARFHTFAYLVRDVQANDDAKLFRLLHVDRGLQTTLRGRLADGERSLLQDGALKLLIFEGINLDLRFLSDLDRSNFGFVNLDFDVDG